MSITGLTSMLAHNLSTGQALLMIDNTGSTAIFDCKLRLFLLVATGNIQQANQTNI
ncbi:hypothetical protein [Mucilaginibacter oryzae]|uniref:hypothetical protein n=1 Tax=Mucilaginibacter oryzae TaxID=468058 RepID=UPI001472D118|nr:hypothetical protein [Mucilaginibacter oryzae]